MQDKITQVKKEEKWRSNCAFTEVNLLLFWRWLLLFFLNWFLSHCYNLGNKHMS
jgi:hypothetical protein